LNSNRGDDDDGDSLLPLEARIPRRRRRRGESKVFRRGSTCAMLWLGFARGGTCILRTEEWAGVSLSLFIEKTSSQGHEINLPSAGRSSW